MWLNKLNLFLYCRLSQYLYNNQGLCEDLTEYIEFQSAELCLQFDPCNLAYINAIPTKPNYKDSATYSVVDHNNSIIKRD